MWVHHNIWLGVGGARDDVFVSCWHGEPVKDGPEVLIECDWPPLHYEADNLRDAQQFLNASRASLASITWRLR